MTEAGDIQSPEPPTEGTESLARRVLRELEELDVAVYQAVEATPTPLIDVPLRRLSRSANHAKLYMAIAALLFAAGGRKGRRAALTGMVAVGVNSAVVNIPMKLAGNRPRPARGTVRIAEERHVKMPTSTSFPSGHSASGFAFAAGVAEAHPGARRAAPRAGDGRGVLARAHGGPLPWRRHRRVARGHGRRRGDGARIARPAQAPAGRPRPADAAR